MDINKLMQQAKQMQNELEKANNQINTQEFEGVASNGLVKIKMNGEYKVVSVDIDESIIDKEDKDMIQDLIMIATNEAVNKIDEAKKRTLGAMAQGFKI